MTTQSKIYLANIVGMFVLALGMFGIDVTEEQRGQIIAGLGAIGTVINMAIVAFRSQNGLIADEVDAVIKRTEKGFASPNFLLVIALVCIVLAMFGCAGIKPPNTIAATSVAIEQVAMQIDLAQKSGQISNEREDKLLGDLQNLNQQLRIASSLTGEAQTADLESINAQLIELRAKLAKEQDR